MIWLDVDAALAEVPVNCLPLISDSDFVTVDETIAYNESGMDLYWHFVTTAGVTTVTSVTPTTSGVYDWAHQDHGMYTIEIPDTGGGSINNDREGFGYFTGVCDAVLPWRGPTIGFRAAGLNDKLCNWLYSPYRGLAGTALPNANADAAFGIPTSDAGGLDLDAILADTNELQTNQGAWATATGFSTHTAANVWSVATRKLTATGLDLILKDSTFALAMADAVWDELLAGHTTADTFGLVLNELDVYHADIDLSVDEANTQDEWTATWFLNGVAVTSSITVPKIQVVKRADGTDLIAATSMSEIGSTGSYKKDEGTNRITAGQAVVAIVTATIGGSSREFRRVVSRDSTA